jgi:hypothetical protein
MSSPCPDLTAAGCFGPYRVQLRLTLPDDYEEQWVPPPGGGVPIARVSEVQLALNQALSDIAADVLVSVTTQSDEHGTVMRAGLVLISSMSTFRGPANHEGTDPDTEPEPLPPGVQVWTAEVWTYAAEPPTAAPLDYAYIAGLWASHLGGITTASGVDAQVLVEGVWLAANLPAEELDPEYPTSPGHTIEIAAA